MMAIEERTRSERYYVIKCDGCGRFGPVADYEFGVQMKAERAGWVYDEPTGQHLCEACAKRKGR